MEKGFKPQANCMKWRVILEPDQETGEWAVWCPELSKSVRKNQTM
jgi:hypothetical protein